MLVIVGHSFGGSRKPHMTIGAVKESNKFLPACTKTHLTLTRHRRGRIVFCGIGGAGPGIPAGVLHSDLTCCQACLRLALSTPVWKQVPGDLKRRSLELARVSWDGTDEQLEQLRSQLV